MWIKAGGALPYSESLIQQITTPKWGFKNGKRCLEEKEQIKKRLKISPDDYDALALTFSIPDCPAQDSLEAQMQGTGKMLSDWDPYSVDRL
jgi:hypothetical protein